jgi:L-fuculose-phosphate aldolase
LSDAALKAAYVEEIAEVYYHALLLNGGKEPPTLPLEDLTLQYPKEIIQG